MAKIVYLIMSFYIFIFIMLNLLSISTTTLEFPELDEPVINAGGINAFFGFFAVILSYITWFTSIIGFILSLMVLNIVSFPLWLNGFIFLPPSIFLLYETFARIIRGS